MKNPFRAICAACNQLIEPGNGLLKKRQNSWKYYHQRIACLAEFEDLIASARANLHPPTTLETAEIGETIVLDCSAVTYNAHRTRLYYHATRCNKKFETKTVPKGLQVTRVW